MKNVDAWVATKELLDSCEILPILNIDHCGIFKIMKPLILRFFLHFLLISLGFTFPQQAVLAEGLTLADAPFMDGDPSAPQSDESAATYEMVDCAAVGDIPLSECLALLDFYESTNGDGWIYYEAHVKPGVFFWFETGIAFDWEGVTVTGGHVTDLILDNHNLSGFIPETISDLPYLLEICLMSNQIGGTLPEALGDLANLEKISLSNNAFSGEIPASLGNIASLEKIMIGNNLLSGSIPAELGNLPLLDRLHLYNNQLTGALPDSLGQLTLLEELIIYGNPLTGLVPSSFINLSNMYYFYFFGTDLCERTDPAFLAWKATVTEWQGAGCVCRLHFPVIFR